MLDNICEVIQSMSDDDVWAFFEGNLEKDKEDAIRHHFIECNECIQSFAESAQKVNDSDEKRYNLFHQENLAVRKAELLRFCKKKGIDIDITKIKTAYDYFKYAIGAMVPLMADTFYKTWDESEDSVKDEIVLDIMKTLHDID